MTAGERPDGGVSHGAAWSLVYIGASRLGTFGLSVLVARLLGPVQAGAFGVALQVSTLTAFAGVLNVGQALSQKLGETSDPARQRRIIDVAFLLVVGGTLLAGGVVAALAPWIARVVYADPGLTTTLLWCGPLAAATGVFIWADGALQGLRRFRGLAAYGASAGLLDLAAAGVGALWGLPALLAARTFGRLASAAAAAAGFPPRSGANTPVTAAAADRDALGDRRAIARGLLRFGGPAFFAAALVFVGQNLLRLLLVRDSGLAAAGHYQAADTVGQVLMLVPTAAGIAYLPAVARDRAAGSPLLATSTGRAVRRVTGFNLPLCLAVIALGPLLVQALFGDAYREAGAALQWLGVAYALAGLGSIAGPVLLGRAEVGTATLLNLLWLVSLFVALRAGGAAGGAQGAALALTIAYALQLAACVVLATRRWKVALPPTLAPFLTTILLPLGALFASRRAPGMPLLVMAGILFAAGLVFARWAAPELSGLRARFLGGVRGS